MGWTGGSEKLAVERAQLLTAVRSPHFRGFGAKGRAGPCLR